MSLEDKFAVKMPAVSSTEKTKSHLPLDLTVEDRARKYPFCVDDRLKMQPCDGWSFQLEVRDGQAPQVFLWELMQKCLIFVSLMLNLSLE